MKNIWLNGDHYTIKFQGSKVGVILINRYWRSDATPRALAETYISSICKMANIRSVLGVEEREEKREEGGASGPGREEEEEWEDEEEDEEKDEEEEKEEKKENGCFCCARRK